MFGKMIIENVEFNKVDAMAVEVFIESFVKTVDMMVAFRDGKTYLVNKGKSTVVDEDYVITMVKDFMIGKTLEEVERNSRINITINELNLVSRVTLKESEEIKAPSLFE